MSEIMPSKKGSTIFDALKLLPLQPLLLLREQIEITRGYARGIRGLGDRVKAVCFQVVQSGVDSVGTCVVVVEQQAVGAVVWMVCTASLEDLAQANVDVLHGIYCLSSPPPP